MIYVSLSNGSLIKYCLSCPTDLQLVQLMQVVPNKLINASLPELSALDRLQLSGEFLLAGGYTGLYRVPLQTCAALGAKFTECLRDPMCYFDLSESLGAFNREVLKYTMMMTRQKILIYPNDEIILFYVPIRHQTMRGCYSRYN